MIETEKSSKKYYLSILLIIITVIFWGYSFISTKVILDAGFPPISIAFFRQIIASIVLGAWLLLTKSFSKITRGQLGIIIASSFCGIVLYFVFENIGIQYSTASNASMIVATVPIFTLISEVIFYKLKVTFKILICLITSIVGVYLIITVNGKLNFSSSMFFGNVLVLGAMVVWVAYTMLNKNLSKNYSSILITTYQSFAAVFLFMPFIMHEVPNWNKLTIVPLLHLIYLGVFCSALAYFFYIYASKNLGATISSAFLNLIPVVTVAASYIQLNEKILLIQVVGISLVMLSLYKLNSK